jgi:hypothetical protein
MPPVKKESADKPANKTLQHRAVPASDMKQGKTAKPVKPEFISGEGDTNLQCIYK